LETRGLLEALLPKAIRAENAGAVVTAIRSGQAQAGFVYGSDAIRAKECITLFQIRRHSTPIRYVASATVKGHTKKEVKALLEFLSSHSAAFRFRLCGFHSVQNRTKP
jgi:molybdate transport system substrate-binding protein